MLATLLVLLRSLMLTCCGHRAVALDNMALRQQLAALTRTRKRPQLRTRDRLFWVCLARAWRDWRTALVVVHPDTVVRWHRNGSAASGRGAQRGSVRAARVRMRPFVHA